MISKTSLATFAALVIVSVMVVYDNQTAEPYTAEPAGTSEPEQLSERWTYTVQRDEMRNTSTKVASVNAEGHGETAAKLSVFEVEGVGYMTINSSFSRLAPSLRCLEGQLTIKFDDNPPRTAWCKMVGLSIGIDPSLYSRLKASRVTQVEVETDELSTQQYKFITENLTL